MFKKFNLKWLSIIFVGLLAIVLIATPKRNNKTSRSFKSELTDFDTAKVTSIVIYPKNSDELITLEKSGDKWKVMDADGNKYNADFNQVENMLVTLFDLKAKRLASRDKAKWAEYHANDSLGVRVQVIAGKKVAADVIIGKFDYQQPQDPNPYAQRQQGIMTTFVRLTDDKDVYAVDGFLSMTFSRDINEFRDGSVIRFSRDKATRLSFITPEGNYNLVKQDSVWMIDGLIADSAGIADYLSNVSFTRNTDFISNSEVLSQKAGYMLTIEADDLKEPLKVQAFAADTTNGYAISSNMNAGTYFSGNKSGLFDKIFKTKQFFIPVAQ